MKSQPCPECGKYLKGGAKKCYACSWGHQHEEPEPKPFIACGLCVGTGLVGVRNKVTKATAMMICGCGNGALRTREDHNGRTYARWGHEAQREWDAIPAHQPKRDDLGSQYTDKARELSRRFMANEGDQSLLADELYEFAMKYPKMGWWDIANLAMCRYYRSRGFPESDYKSCLPKEP